MTGAGADGDVNEGRFCTFDLVSGRVEVAGVKTECCSGCGENVGLAMRLVGALSGLGGGLAKLVCLTAGRNGVRSPVGVMGRSC